MSRNSPGKQLVVTLMHKVYGVNVTTRWLEEMNQRGLIPRLPARTEAAEEWLRSLNLTPGKTRTLPDNDYLASVHRTYQITTGRKNFSGVAVALRVMGSPIPDQVFRADIGLIVSRLISEAAIEHESGCFIPNGYDECDCGFRRRNRALDAFLSSRHRRDVNMRMSVINRAKTWEYDTSENSDYLVAMEDNHSATADDTYHDIIRNARGEKIAAEATLFCLGIDDPTSEEIDMINRLPSLLEARDTLNNKPVADVVAVAIEWLTYRRARSGFIKPNDNAILDVHETAQAVIDALTLMSNPGLSSEILEEVFIANRENEGRILNLLEARSAV